MRIGWQAGEFLGGAVVRGLPALAEVEELLVIVAQLGAYQPPMTRWRQWQREESVLADHDFAAVRRELLDRRVARERKDEILAALIRRAQQGRDDDARLATIVCLLPGVRRLAGRFGDVLGWHDALAELLASLWIQLEALDLDRRSDRIASRLLAVSAHRLASLARRERAWRDRTSPGDDVDRLCLPGRALEPTGVAGAVRAGVLDSFDATLIEATRLNGLSLVDAAMLLGVTYEAAKKRRRRAEAAWMAWWAPDRRPVHVGVEPVAA
jgi:hypothetical protein